MSTAEDTGMIQPPTPNEAKQPIDPAIVAALTENRQDFLRVLTRRLGTVDTAEEVLQHFYLRAVSKAFTLQKRESILAWLYKLLRTVLVDYVRREATRRRQEAAYRQHQVFTQEDPELESTICTCFSRLLPTLKPAYTHLLWRLDMLGEPRHKVAVALGLTVNNVTVRLHRARQALKRALLLSCHTCPEHGFLHCTCDLRSLPMDTTEQAQSCPPGTIMFPAGYASLAGCTKYETCQAATYDPTIERHGEC